MVLPVDQDRRRDLAGRSQCNHRDVRARPVEELDPPARGGVSPVAQKGDGTSVAGARAFVRRLTRSDRAMPVVFAPADVTVTSAADGTLTSATPPSGGALEAELAERLDTVLGIAGRLAASHDRADLFRMVVDETKRALRADATTIRVLHDDTLEVAAWAGLPDELAGKLPVFRRDEGWVGEVLRTGHVLAYPDVRGDQLHASVPYDAAVPGRRPSDRAAHPPRPGPGRAVRRHA